MGLFWPGLRGPGEWRSTLVPLTRGDSNMATGHVLIWVVLLRCLGASTNHDFSSAVSFDRPQVGLGPLNCCCLRHSAARNGLIRRVMEAAWRVPTRKGIRPIELLERVSKLRNVVGA